jgi:hypothetical protein
MTVINNASLPTIPQSDLRVVIVSL